MNFNSLIDTRPGQISLFSPPPNVENYLTWLTNKYKQGHFKDGDKTCLCGVAQKVHEFIQRPADIKDNLVAVGPHAGYAAQFIEDLASNEYGKNIRVGVIPW